MSHVAVKSQPLPDEAAAPKMPELPALAETVIRPPSAWQALDVAELWRYRDLLVMLTWRNISVRYKQTVLGVAWAVLQPVLMMVVFGVVFGRLAGLSSGDLPYPIFVYAGLLPWLLFATAVTNAANSVVESERLVTKVYFPRLAIPLSAILAALVDFAIAFGVLIVLMIAYGVAPGWNMFLAPVPLLLIVLAAVAVGSLLAALNVAYRDFRYVVTFLVQLWMFATPSIYMETNYELRSTNYEGRAERKDEGITNDELRMTKAERDSADRIRNSQFVIRNSTFLNLNPLTPLIAAFRATTLGGQVAWGNVSLAAITVTVMLVIGLAYFRRVESSFADII
jgi:lipopolysaccharide transport system permease protein